VSCPACGRIAARHQADTAWSHLFIADLDETAVYLHEHQRYEGWCVLFLKDHAEHLADLPADRQARIFGEVAKVAAAVRGAMNPRRINYECLGNQLHHVHWHVVPRYLPPMDPDPNETVWVRPANERNAGVTRERAGVLIGRIRACL
jgi:diadenosine tetraphosphate (Ap4A) HIT family hydrolase